MRKLVYLLALMLLVTGISTWAGAEEKSPTFRKAHWGQSRAEIVKQESGLEKIDEDTYYISFKDRLDNKDCKVLYYFTKGNQLYQGLYTFTVDHSNYNLYIDDFISVYRLVKKKYGAETRNSVEWKDNLYKDDYDDRGRAIAYGHLEMSYSWELTNDTTVWLRITGDNGYIFIDLAYFSNTLEYDWDDDKGKI